VIDEAYTAVGALGCPPARRTLDRGGVATPIEQDNTLFSPLEAASERLDKLCRYELLAAPLVHDPDRGQFGGAAIYRNALRHGQQRVFVGAGVGQALQAGCGRSEDTDGTRNPRPDDGYVAGMVPGSRIESFATSPNG